MRIGIVNDMPLAREALRRVVTSVPGHEIAWLAADGAEAVAATKKDRPDLILMDLIMPGVDGAEATRRIMADTPCPILVVTSSVSGHMCKVYEAMGHGALDAADTPSLGPCGEVAGAAMLIGKIATIAKLLGKPPLPHAGTATAAAPASRASRRARERLVAIGSSTGGPNALAEVLAELPPEFDAPVVLVQHVDSTFALGLARWLSQRTQRRVDVASPGDAFERGRVLLAGTNDHLVLEADLRLRYVEEPREACFRPSVDVFFKSLLAHWPDPGVAVLLTGMGRDGASGLLALRRAGWHTIAQDEATSVIFGMPRAAAEMGAAVEVLPLTAIGAAVAREASRRWRDEGVLR